MITIEELLARVSGIDWDELEDWIERGCVDPIREGETVVFREIDVARVRLIVEIRDDLNVRRENIPLVLSLIDQVHGLRSQLRTLATAIDAQPADVRRRIKAHLERAVTNR